MPYCPNCGSQVEAVHHYCGSCGQALSKTAESEDDPPMVVNRGGFLSLRSLSYINDLLNGDCEPDQESVLHAQLSRDVSAAFADFARLAMVGELDLLQLWAAGSSDEALNVPIEEMSSEQFQDWLAMLGLGRTLRMYDASLHTVFEEEFNNRLQRIVEYAEEELHS